MARCGKEHRLAHQRDYLLMMPLFFFPGIFVNFNFYRFSPMGINA